MVVFDRLERWRERFGPQLQPFNIAWLGVGAPEIGRPATPALEIRDAFHVYSDDGWTRLEEEEFAGLDLTTRRALLQGRAATGRLGEIPDRFRSFAEPQKTDSQVIWWPPLLRTVGDDPLLRYVENGLSHSRHREVTAGTWARKGCGWQHWSVRRLPQHRRTRREHCHHIGGARRTLRRVTLSGHQ